MPRIVVFNDPHFSSTEPECRAPSYPQEILAKLHEVARLAVKLKAQGIGCTGDWFHRKGKVTFRELNDLLAVLSGWRHQGLEVVGIAGNHDIAGHALDSLDSRAIGGLVHAKVLRLLDHEPWTVSDDDGTLHVTGTSYFHGCDASDEARVRMYGARRPADLPEDAVHLHFAHGTLLQRGEFFEDFTTAEPLIELLAAHDALPDVITCGHLHFSEGVKTYPRPGAPGRTVSVCRVGSTGRVAADDLDRQPACLVVASRGAKVVLREVPIGAAPKRALGQDGEPASARSPEEHEARIKDFVRILREEAEDFSLLEHDKLLRAISDKLGHDEGIYQRALAAVEKRQ